LEDLNEEELKCFLVPDKILQRYATALDIVRKDSHHSCCFTKAYGNYAVGTGSVLQHSLDETALQEAFASFSKFKDREDSAGAVECLRDLKLRYFTPKEVANLMGFPQDFHLPTALSVRQCYKALGNSLNVKVVSLLIKYLIQ
jgi:tRNA (cytosine38-C5)-methyltransferase